MKDLSIINNDFHYSSKSTLASGLLLNVSLNSSIPCNTGKLRSMGAVGAVVDLTLTLMSLVSYFVIVNIKSPASRHLKFDTRSLNSNKNAPFVIHTYVLHDRSAGP